MIVSNDSELSAKLISMLGLHQSLLQELVKRRKIVWRVGE